MHKCSQMPYHMGIILKLYLSNANRHLVAVNAGAQRAVYNYLVATDRELYRMRQAADCVPVYRDRIEAFRQADWKSQKAIRNAMPFLYEPCIDGQTIANARQSYNAAWKNMKERHTGIPAFHKKTYACSYQTNCHYKADDTGLSDDSVCFIDPHHIKLPLLGIIRCAGSPKLIRKLMQHNDSTRIGTVTIGRDAVGEYWVSLQIASDQFCF